MKGKILGPEIANCINGVVIIGDSVKIVGDVYESKQIVNVPMDMSFCINDDKVYQVQGIKKSIKGPIIIKVGGWWWGEKNIKKLVTEKPKKIKPQTFEIDQLVI